MQLIPALDILDGQVVRLIRGDYSQKTVYSDQPVEMAGQFKDAGVKRLHLVDLSGAREKKPVHAGLFGKIKQVTNCRIEAGGGVRSLKDFELFFEAGLNLKEDFIMIGSLPFKNPAEFQVIQSRYAENILLTVDVWGRKVRISGWEEDTKQPIGEFLKKMTEGGIRQILVTQIKNDGMLSGPDYDLYREISDEFKGVQITVSGGMSNLKEAEDLKEISGVSGFIVGKAFYENKITLEDIQKYNHSV